MPPPSTQTMQPLSVQYPGLPLAQPSPQPTQFIQQNIMPPQPAVPQMIAVSASDPRHQYIQAQGPQILTAPPPGAPVYYIQHPGVQQPTPVVIMPEAEVKLFN